MIDDVGYSVGCEPGMSDDYTPLNLDPFGAHQLVIKACGGARTVLDVGCSAGTLAAVLSAEQNMTVDGIEPDPAAAELARRYCRTVMNVDIETIDVGAFDGRRYDAIVLADVLEHLRDPEATLRRLHALLEAAGWIVISTPNIANWSMRAQLLVGRFEYTERGIMDRTHLHFFTRTSLLRALRTTGFRLTRFDVTCPLPVLRRPPFSRWAHDAALRWPGLLAYQFVVIARPSPG
jgi:2-polyprenyl-3-methyl-5-hydroxy-6-metoxy-1,4-benzoquinol methylase